MKVKRLTSYRVNNVACYFGYCPPRGWEKGQTRGKVGEYTAVTPSQPTLRPHHAASHLGVLRGCRRTTVGHRHQHGDGDTLLQTAAHGTRQITQSSGTNGERGKRFLFHSRRIRIHIYVYEYKSVLILIVQILYPILCTWYIYMYIYEVYTYDSFSFEQSCEIRKNPQILYLQAWCDNTVVRCLDRDCYGVCRFI